MYAGDDKRQPMDDAAVMAVCDGGEDTPQQALKFVLFHPASTCMVQLPHVLSQIAAAELHTHESVSVHTHESDSVRSLGRGIPAWAVGERFEFEHARTTLLPISCAYLKHEVMLSLEVIHADQTNEIRVPQPNHHCFAKGHSLNALAKGRTHDAR